MINKQKSEKINIVVGLIANLALFVFKILAGIFGGSSALIADGVHSATDVTTDIAVLIGSRFWHNPPDENHAYGHGRIETAISFGIGIILGFTAIQLSADAICNLFADQHTPVHFWVFWVALTSIVLKELLFHYTIRVSKQTDSMALKANAWHHRTDSISSIPVAGAIYLSSVFPNLWWIDSVGVLLVSVFIFKTCYDIIKPAFTQLVDTGADKKIINNIESITLSVSGIRRINNIRTRYIGSSLIVDMKIEIDSKVSIDSADRLAVSAKKKLLDEMKELGDVSITVEPHSGG